MFKTLLPALRDGDKNGEKKHSMLKSRFSRPNPST